MKPKKGVTITLDVVNVKKAVKEFGIKKATKDAQNLLGLAIQDIMDYENNTKTNSKAVRSVGSAQDT